VTPARVLTEGTAPVSDSGLRRIPRRIGPYEVLRRLGRGASSDVLEVKDERSGVRRALKLFAGAQPGDGFVREAGVGLELRHPNLLAAHDMGYVDAGTRFVAFDLAEGGSLRGRLTAPRQPIPFVRHVLVELGRALTVLHEAGLVHRDLKPENVLLTGPETFARIRLGDLGTCGVVRHGPALGDIGSPAYMAPEQINGECTTQADIYALGVLAYEMIAGGRPFVGSPTEVLEAHLKREPSLAGIPAPAAPILGRALAKSPERRFLNVMDFVRALDAALEEIDGAVAPARPGDILAYDAASSACIRRSGPAAVTISGVPATNETFELTADGAAAVAASALVRVVLHDGANAVLASGDDEPVTLASPMYGLPPVAAIRRLAGDAVIVEGGGAPSIAFVDARGRASARSSLPLPVGSLTVASLPDGEHVIGVDLQRKSLVAVHARGIGKRAQVIPSNVEIRHLEVRRGHIRVAFASGANGELCADGDGQFHLLGWGLR